MANINKCGSNNKANGKYHLKVLNKHVSRCAKTETPTETKRHPQFCTENTQNFLKVTIIKKFINYTGKYY